MGFIKVRQDQAQKYHLGLVALEAESEYPLGTDSFRIDHGKDYFRFFRRLGKVDSYLWTENSEIRAVLSAVLRRIPFKNPYSPSDQDGIARDAWYLCDLKVHPHYRNRKLPLKLASRAFLSIFLRCRRGYAISMNSPSEVENRIVRLARHFRWALMRPQVRLSIWSLTSERMTQALPLLEKHRGKVGFCSLSGIKDIVLRSTGQPAPLLHVQFGPFGDFQMAQPQPQALHMFCVPHGDPLASDLENLGILPTSSATILAYRMEQIDWSWVLTSDI